MTKARDLADLGNKTSLDEINDAYDAGALSNRNLIINGSMAISQRSLSVSSLTGTGYKTVDRIRINGSGGTYNQSQQTVTVGGETGLPVQFTKFLRHECTVGNDNHILMNRTEDVSKFVGTMKLSFYAKGSGADVLAVKFHQAFGSGGSADIYTSAQSFTVTSTWQRFEFNIVMPSITGKTVGTGNYGSVLFGQDSSNSTAAWTLDITGLQWEHGDTATPFEHRSYGDELAKCQRYYYRLDGAGGQTYNAHLRQTNGSGTQNYAQEIAFPITMRATPSVTVSYQDMHKPGIRYDTINSVTATGSQRSLGLIYSVATADTNAISTQVRSLNVTAEAEL
jgi:hypothetical protein